jgi:hypothetical protein
MPFPPLGWLYPLTTLQTISSSLFSPSKKELQADQAAVFGSASYG